MFELWLAKRTKMGIAAITVVLAMTGMVLLPHGDAPASATQGTHVTMTPDQGMTSPEDRSHATFHYAPIRGSIALNRSKVLANTPGRVFAQLRVSADTNVQGGTPPSANLVLVVDTSGSMAGQKIADAKRALKALVRELQPRDRFAIVQFSDRPRVVLPFQRIEDARQQAQSAVARLTPSGSTDLHKALALAHHLLETQARSGPQRIVLVTDGRDTSGTPKGVALSDARKATRDGITISTLGIGADYDDLHLANIAHEGRGNYEYLADTSSLRSFVRKELQQTRKTVAINVRAYLRLPRGAHLVDAWGASARTTDGTVVLSLGSLFAGDQRRATVLIELPASKDDETLRCDLRLFWLSPREDKRRVRVSPLLISVVSDPEQVAQALNPEVDAEVQSVQASALEKKAAKAFEQGNRARAIGLNKQSQRLLDSATKKAKGKAAERLRAQRKSYEANRGVYEKSKPSAAAARPIGAREEHNLDRSVAY